jgi:hypothetical protein
LGSAEDRAEAAEHKPGMTPYRRGLRNLFVEPLAELIKAKLQDKAHLPHGRLGALLQAAEPRVLALMALEAVVPATDRPLRVQSFKARIKERIGEIFYANSQLKEFIKHEPKARGREILRGRLKRARRETIRDWQTRLRRHRSKIWQSLLAPVSRRELVHAGAWLLQCIIDAEILVFCGRNLLPTSKYIEHIGRLRRFIIRSNVRLLPVPDTPPRWTKPEIYHCGLKIQLLPHWNPAHRARIAESFRSEHFQRQHLAALHTLESVPQQIDEWTLDLVRQYAKKIPKYDDDGRRLADENRVDAEIKTAERLARRGVFHNKYRLDFCGRIYAREDFSFIQHDRIRSLIRFANGAVLTRDGLRWLKIHAANTYGQDKISYDDRVKWVEQHRNRIARVAADPNASFEFWSNADKPFAFAAACRELASAQNNPGFITTLPLAFDHTASGIQHLAMIGLDEKAAPKVNLVETDAPQDIYGELAAATIELFDDSEQAEFWRDKLSDPGKARKLLKQPGMTFSYAATDRGNIRQVNEQYSEVYDDEPPPFDHVVYLIKCFRKACAEILPGPFQVMQYIQAVVKECNKRRQFASWESPSGVLVSNIYPKAKVTTIYTLDGARTDLSEGAIRNTINKRKTKSAAAANFVHSLDASHLVRVVNALAANHMSALCVHDCFAVLAPHAELFHRSNRSELALMYDGIFEAGGPFAQWRNIPVAPPSLGTFDIWQVEKATYACS